MLDKVGKYEFLAEPFHCDFSKRLFMGHLGNHMLNAADFHAAHRGFGMTYLNPLHKTWVLSRLAIEMEKMPPQYAKFYVETWVEGVMKFFTNRNFRVVDAEDENLVYGYGRSIWALIDTDSRQPQNIMDIRDGEILNYIETDKACPIGALSRVRMSKDARLVASVPTHYSDVDVNGHINSVKYIEHVLDLFALDTYREYRIKRFDIAYVAESYYGDTLNYYREDVSDDVFCVRITRVPPESSEETEVCRCKIEFVKD
ncbi:acyl-[acyl-carrier-protein] thioesterase [uncultured Prevotella sp.]|uniref:acyl-[acyl-carrier-protein] thioesterase n=1 Tax=uncultured Prevotella sp. TaxID=159272 RepID=UPI0026772CAF|nr:acyl-ACP thioesterase domain-containing protein [uncultured Prevotella sp.]